MPLLSNIQKILEKLLYKRFCTFLNSKNIYNLQFVFRQHYSTSHLLINITEKRVALDEGNLKQKKFDGDLKVRLFGKRLYPTKCVCKIPGT